MNIKNWMTIMLMSSVLVCSVPFMCSCEEEIIRPEVTEPLMPDLGPEGTAGSIGTAEVTQKVVFSAGPSGQTYRIPAMVTAKDGSLLIFAEDRHASWKDKGFTDIVVKRSEDNGVNWSGQTGITNSINDGGYAFMDPSPIVDEETGTIYLFFNRWKKYNTDVTNNRAFMSVSEDHGKTWSVPEDVSGNILAPGMFCAGFGPGHGIQIRQGRYKGRLITITRQNDGSRGYCYSIYSDDHGKTWNVGTEVQSGESQIAESGEDQLYLNIRRGSTRECSFSNDGGRTWSPSAPDASLPTVNGGCEASVLGTGNNTVFYCGPGSGPEVSGHDNRYNLKLFRSASSAKMWTRSQVLYEMASGYSDMTLLQDGRLAIVFEAGSEKGFIKTGGNVRPVGWMRLDLLILPAQITDYDYWF